MSGPLTVPFTIAALFVQASIYKVLFGILAIFCAGFSSYWVWRSQRLASIADMRKVEEKTSALEAQLNELQKLKFVIDIPETHVSIEQCGGGPQGIIFCIDTEAKLRFENHDNHRRTVLDLSVSLYEQYNSSDEQKVDTKMRPSHVHLLLSKERVNIYDGILVDGGGISPFYSFLITMQLPIGLEKKLNPNYFLRITMLATGQLPESIDCNVNWEQAFKDDAPIILRSKTDNMSR